MNTQRSSELGFLFVSNKSTGARRGYKQHSWVKTGELRTECRKVLCRRFLMELFRQVMDIVLVGRGVLNTSA